MVRTAVIYKDSGGILYRNARNVLKYGNDYARSMVAYRQAVGWIYGS